MHEYSIVQSLLNSCQEHVDQHQATKVTKVVVKIGVMSGVEPHLLQEAFDTFKEKTVCEASELQLQIQKVVVYCQKCGQQSELQKHEYLCPLCQSTELEIIDGEEMLLMQLELE